MNSLLRQTFGWHAGPPAWGPAMVAGFGCALPLLLGLFSAHPGFSGPQWARFRPLR